MAWRVAYSLNRLLDQFNALAPTRNNASDGSIGDISHQNKTSDHNPWYPPPNGGIVTARDFTHDPAKLSMHWVADTLTVHRDPRIKYIIWDRRIWSPSAGWRAYTGSNPHTSHLHLSVVASPACDSTAAWAGFIPQPQENDMELTDSMAGGTPPYFAGPAPAEAAKVGNLLASVYVYSKDAVRLGNLAMVALTNVLAEVTNDPDLSAEAIKELMDASVRENAPAAQPVDLEAIKQVVREAAAEDNVTLADDIVDRIATRVAN